jgi:hypothetical protein
MQQNIEKDDVSEKASAWLSDELQELELEKLTLADVIELLEVIEEITKSRPERIYFYGDEEFSCKFMRRAGKLKVGFVARSKFVGIVGSVIAECFEEKARKQSLAYHLNLYKGIDDGPYTVIGFLKFLVGLYESYTLDFGLEDEFSGEYYARKVVAEKLTYTNIPVTSTLDKVERWDVERLKTVRMVGFIKAEKSKINLHETEMQQNIENQTFLRDALVQIERVGTQKFNETLLGLFRARDFVGSPEEVFLGVEPVIEEYRRRQNELDLEFYEKYLSLVSPQVIVGNISNLRNEEVPREDLLIALANETTQP